MNNKKHNCIIIDDEYLARKLLSDYVSKVPELNLIGSYETPLDATNDIQNQFVRIIFTDIDMPDLTGVEFIENLKIPNRPLVIFVTAFSEYAAKAFEIDAIEYLLKPVTFPRFFKAANKALRILSIEDKARNIASLSPSLPEKIKKVSEEEFFIVKTERKLVKIPYCDILFVEGALEYVNFQTRDKKIMGLYSLKQLETELPKDRFMRIHKSYIVALDKITMVDGNQVQVGDWKISVSKTFRNQLLDRITSSNV